MANVTLEVHFAWWLKPYLWGVTTCCLMTGLEPDWQKVRAKIAAAISLRVKQSKPC